MGAREVPRYVFPRDSGSFIVLVANSDFKWTDIFLKDLSNFRDLFD